MMGPLGRRIGCSPHGLAGSDITAHTCKQPRGRRCLPSASTEAWAERIQTQAWGGAWSRDRRHARLGRVSVQASEQTCRTIISRGKLSALSLEPRGRAARTTEIARLGLGIRNTCLSGRDISGERQTSSANCNVRIPIPPVSWTLLADGLWGSVRSQRPTTRLASTSGPARKGTHFTEKYPGAIGIHTGSPPRCCRRPCEHLNDEPWRQRHGGGLMRGQASRAARPRARSGHAVLLPCPPWPSPRRFWLGRTGGVLCSPGEQEPASPYSEHWLLTPTLPHERSPKAFFVVFEREGRTGTHTVLERSVCVMVEVRRAEEGDEPELQASVNVRTVSVLKPPASAGGHPAHLSSADVWRRLLVRVENPGSSFSPLPFPLLFPRCASRSVVESTSSEAPDPSITARLFGS